MLQSTEIATQVISLLAAVASRGATMAQDIATRTLGDIVAERLGRDGHGSAWEDFKRRPQNDSLVRYLLAQAIQQDAEFGDNIVRAARAVMKQQAQNNGTQSITITGSGDAQIGHRGDTFRDSRVATHGGTYHEGDINNQDNRVSNKKSSGAFVALGIVALVVIVIAVVAAKVVPGLINKATQGGGLTANSTCQQFLNTDEQTEQQALVDIAISKGISGFGSPLALPEIRYECSSEPTMTLGALVERDRNEFG